MQQLLPKLATYLGHAKIASTQQYLQVTPELLHEASLRFAAYAHVVDDGVTGGRSCVITLFLVLGYAASCSSIWWPSATAD